MAFAQLALFIEHAVIGQDEMGAIADEQILADGDAHLPQALDLADERDRIDDDAVADHTNLAAAQNAGRNEMEDVLGPAMDDGVPGVVAALAADDDVGLARSRRR